MSKIKNEIAQARRDIALAEERLEKLEKELEEKKEKPQTVWDLSVWDTYYCIDMDGDISSHIITDYQSFVWKRDQGNAFLTEAEALKEVDRRAAKTRILRRISELNDGWVPDWGNNNSKWFIYLGRRPNILYITYQVSVQCHSDAWYLRSQEDAELLISEMGDDLKTLFGVES